jgi:FkbM family methyltransferase
MFRFPSTKSTLEFMTAAGVEIGTIIDVGAHAETRELRLAFANKKHVLFEPAEEFFAKIASNYSGMDWELVPSAVLNSDGNAMLRKIAIAGNEISHAKLEFGSDRKGLVQVPTVRLDTFFINRSDAQPYLLKVDVDGLEIPILEGAEGIWDRIDCIIVEATSNTFAERLQFVQSRAFRIFDIVDICYYAGVFAQADLIMLSERAWSNPRLRPLETEKFDWNNWMSVSSLEGHLMN